MLWMRSASCVVQMEEWGARSSGRSDNCAIYNTQSFSVHVHLILYKQNRELKKIETEKKDLQMNHLCLSTEEETLKPQRQTHVGVIDVLLVLQLCFLCFTSRQAIRFTTYVQVSPGCLSKPESSNPVFAFSILHTSPPPPTSCPCPSLQSFSFRRPPLLTFVNLFKTFADKLR